MVSKPRLDDLLLERGLVEDLREARGLIMRGLVEVDGGRCDKAGTRTDPKASIRLLSSGCPFVSRGGLKLEAALDHFGLDPSGECCVDLGASTGGFTDCLLQYGARRVYAFDVGKGQLDWNLRCSERVVVRESYNVRYLEPGDLPEDFWLIVGDLSFISLKLILPPLRPYSRKRMLFLVKPQYEAEPAEVEPGGLITGEEKRREIVRRVCRFAENEGFQVVGTFDSPVKGQKGNRETFLRLGSEP